MIYLIILFGGLFAYSPSGLMVFHHLNCQSSYGNSTRNSLNLYSGQATACQQLEGNVMLQHSPGIGIGRQAKPRLFRVQAVAQPRQCKANYACSFFVKNTSPNSDKRGAHGSSCSCLLHDCSVSPVISSFFEGLGGIPTSKPSPEIKPWQH